MTAISASSVVSVGLVSYSLRSILSLNVQDVMQLALLPVKTSHAPAAERAGLWPGRMKIDIYLS